ncbi:class I SAM-dependent methyltransferase [Flavilitoribacter nigricans]|uniref:Methyltransferase type 11 n=1 Tax=Flavilitoribacter nigricans (strain ATCC 23147 / DSM 23189 / NBRC 102662 / NCIMB 1420 / SS-2) TaxID=1122177 RepID=A0A2D0N9Q6_FLAN2|nr:methyltransferase domain-containing protein [Flavilitoribacter nigricans]PHN05118.1 methyltransferase type 11 [Flavilitoribacter nigricans DSM 23189 = NBRC 102662]
MNTELIQIRENQRNSWNSFSGGWEKWDDFTMRFLRQQGQAIIDELALKPTDKVLDIASGTGEPGLSIAAALSTSGSVIATDLSERMLQIAGAKAQARSLHNFRVEVADACNLPFADHTFDAISCRLGFMFFADMELAAREMLRVLKPGGILAATVWGEPSKNDWITSIIGTLKKYPLELPSPSPNGPGLFRCAAPGFLTSLFAALGATSGQEKDIEGIMSCESAGEYWEFMNDVVPPVVAALKTAEEDLRNNVKQEVFESFGQRINQAAPFSYSARLFTLRKPE